MSQLGNILQDILDIERCLDIYYDLCIENDIYPRKKLTENEDNRRKEIIKDLQNLIKRISADIQAFAQTSCNSFKQKSEEDKNLIDLTREARYTLLRLKRFSEMDANIQNILVQLKKEITTFKTVLQNYINRSLIEVLTWKEAQEEAFKEENDLDF